VKASNATLTSPEEGARAEFEELVRMGRSKLATALSSSSTPADHLIALAAYVEVLADLHGWKDKDGWRLGEWVS
jgi:hypothetical protein